MKKRAKVMATQTTRLSVDMNPKEHKKLKILAEANGMTLKEFILTLLEPVLYPIEPPSPEGEGFLHRCSANAAAPQALRPTSRRPLD